MNGNLTGRIPDTKEMTLEQISGDDYQHLEDCWGDRRNMCSCCGYAVILNPIRAANYADLMERISQVRHAHQICVRKGSKWEKYYVENGFYQRDLDYLAGLASKNDWKKDFINLKLKDKSRTTWDHAIIEFTEHKGAIVGYKARVPNSQMHLFDIKGSRAFAFYNGIWNPAESR